VESGRDASSFRRWEWPGLALVAIVFVAIRAPLLTSPGLLLGWNSDAALFGLMARAMRDGVDVPIFFWGQFYLGTLTSLLTAGVAEGLRMETIGPLALRIAASLEVFAALVFFWLGLRRAFGRGPAMLAAFWLAAGPSFLFHFTIAPIGAEQLFLIAAVLFWYALRSRFETNFEWLVLGLICGAGMWLHQGILFLAAAVGLALLIERKVTWRRIAVAVVGFAVGYLPSIVSLLRDDPLLYKREILEWTVGRVFQNVVDTVKGDLWLLIADESRIGIAIGLVLLTFAAIGLRRPTWNRAAIIVTAAIIISFAFRIFSTYSYAGSVRYIVPILPLLYAAAALGLLRAPRAAAIAVAVAITLGLYVPRVIQARDVAAGRTELYLNWPGSFDPRPVLGELRRGGYGVCYGEVWVAHKLEFLTEPTVRFVPVHSVHRTLRQSLSLIRRPGPKCYVDNDGNVTRLTPGEEAYWASTVVTRGRKAGLLP
jgi:Dolichyl-phosphate-mannose-protein mannosyltransferase